jgi:transcriptional regulator with XRE-family HTH domain
VNRWAEVKERRKLAPDALERVRQAADRDILAMNLRALRESAGKTQEEMAELTSMTQSQLSRIERRDDHLLSTIRRYVEALGGTVEIVAVVKGKRVKLEGV